MTTNDFSTNWPHLKAILVGYANRDRRAEVYSYEEHRQAKALSVFLAHAELPTPRLDRETVAAVLDGSLPWPRTAGEPFPGTDIPLSQIEDFGLLSFYAGWCSIHCNPLVDLERVDSSLMPLIRAINHLREIRDGEEGCIQPRHTCSEGKLRQLLQAEFGVHLSVEALLAELELEDGVFSLPPGNEKLSPLISTYLWMILRDLHEPQEAFSRWIMCFRVNCDWAMPVIFEQLEHEERKVFNEELLNFLTQDTELALGIDSYIRQTINGQDFSGRILPITTQERVLIDEEGIRSASSKTIELPKPTLSSLEDFYTPRSGDITNNLAFLVHHYSTAMRGHEELFYSCLLSTAVESSIHIQGQQLFSEGFTEELVKLAESRPILRYILFVVLPSYEHSNTMVLFLSQAATCDVALYHLSQKRFGHSRGRDASYVQKLEEGYQRLICREYVRSVDEEPDFIRRLISALEMLSDWCNFESSDFSHGFEYHFLMAFLETLEQSQVAQLAQEFSELPLHIEDSYLKRSRHHCRYLLGFWLIDRLESSGGDPTGATSRSLRESILTFYSVQFRRNLEGARSLVPCTFFATLPWGKLLTEPKSNPLLLLSNKCEDWKQRLSLNAPHSFEIASAIRQYLQVLMCLGRSTAFAKPLTGVSARVQEIVRTCGFGPREEFVPLFGDVLVSDKYDLWGKFSAYTNAFEDDLYSEFVARCVPSIPFDHLFSLLEGCTVIAHAQQLNEAIDSRQSQENYELGLSRLEKAFTAACDMGRPEFAARMLHSAKTMLAQERFSRSRNLRIVQIRNVWASYEYKLKMLTLYEEHKADPEGFRHLAIELPIPHEAKSSPGQLSDRVPFDDCEEFRRQMIGMAFSETDPARTVDIMGALYRQTKNLHYGFLQLYGHLKLHAIQKIDSNLRHSLTSFLTAAASIEPDQMRDVWVVTILDAYRLIGAPEIDTFWGRLSLEQHTRLEILSPYCHALVARGDSLTARKILTHFRELNKSTPESELGIEDLISEILNKDTSLTTVGMIQLINEANPSIPQLQKHYAQVASKSFEAFVEIVSPNQLPHEYLKDAVRAVAHELTLRKRNLQIEFKKEKGRPRYKIMLEDWINDWFTSLFDHRMSHAKMGFRDQKRAGQSKTGKNPGEIDGFITAGDNARLAIFEAFRLHSNDTGVVAEHLNKIAGYDTESLSPVFMVGYCDVGNFRSLVDWYGPYVSNLEYAGYSIADDSPRELHALEDTDHIWLGSEIRRRDRKDIIFYHVLINLHFAAPPEALGKARPKKQKL